MPVFKKPYQDETPKLYEQDIYEYKYVMLKDDSTFLTEDGRRNIQDDLNLNVDTNSIYSIIDKFQNTNKVFSDINESIEFMKQIGKNPESIFNGDIVDISNSPKSLAELAKLGQHLREVYDGYISQKNNNQNVNSVGSSNNQVVKQAGPQLSNPQEAKAEKVGDK